MTRDTWQGHSRWRDGRGGQQQRRRGKVGHGSHSGKEMGPNYKSRGRFWKALKAWSLFLMGLHPKHWDARGGVWCRGVCSAHKL